MWINLAWELEMQEPDFCQIFHIPQAIELKLIEDMNEELDTTHLGPKSNSTYVVRKHFNMGLWPPLPLLVYQFLYYFQINQIHVYADDIRILRGAFLLDHL